MMNLNHAAKFDRLTVESLCVAMSFDHAALIPSVNTGWNYTLGSGVT
ncbi:MAG: hypothetical protein KA257_10335 [Opitutaceae bacterium]|jgi:hypothetical protein|nr:hypothetical protein [Opitutaceae bacterium]MBP9913113.1 hypothetical protein [Opitutaceae bacterium]